MKNLYGTRQEKKPCVVTLTVKADGVKEASMVASGLWQLRQELGYSPKVWKQKIKKGEA